MDKSRNKWTELVVELRAYKRKHGDCKVPADYRDNPQLGRWVAAQRYKRKIGVLSETQVRTLDKLGFVWSASDEAWDAMFERLQAFKREHMHCNVPTHWSKNRSLADWVHSQRHRNKREKLPKERIRRLNEIGFCWSIYKSGAHGKKEEKEPRKPEHHAPEERLYYIGNGTYVQYRGKGRKPPELQRFVQTHHGELPPYIPLPKHPVEFRFGHPVHPRMKVRWQGKGKLPVKVMRYVQENGTLPPRTI